MESSTTRNKVEARRIESWLHSQIAELGTTNIAKVAGVNKSTVSPLAGKSAAEHVATAGHPDF
ncbi:bacteriophage CII family protein [Klebsiella pneumoniae]|uniref:Bacteriophage CII family protein n=1 Tax=Klebsiella pneumoniae TaxID=573 RepID=A0A377XWH6_KLEPN|nr:bacteriophage CII family protein [Klebsiella pneumoniae]